MDKSKERVNRDSAKAIEDPSNKHLTVQSLGADITRSGMLKKRSSKGRWQSRFFRLNASYLSYFTSESDSTPQGCLSVSDVVGVEEDGEGITLHLASGGDYCVRSETGDAAAWAASIRAVVGQQRLEMGTKSKRQQADGKRGKGMLRNETPSPSPPPTPTPSTGTPHIGQGKKPSRNSPARGLPRGAGYSVGSSRDSRSWDKGILQHKTENRRSIHDLGDQLKDEAIAWATANGMMVRQAPATEQAAAQTHSVSSETYTHVPFSLLPEVYPRTMFERGIALAPLFNRLVDAVARDTAWLHATLEGACKQDEFTARCVQLSRRVEAEYRASGVAQRYYLGINRSDYMLHIPADNRISPNGVPAMKLAEDHPVAAGGGHEVTNENDGDQPVHLLQVELNTIASSFGCLSHRVSELHRYLANRHSYRVAEVRHVLQNTQKTACASYLARERVRDPFEAMRDAQQRMPVNRAVKELAGAIAAAHRHYLATGNGARDSPAATEYDDRSDDSVEVMFVVQAGERNSVDQRMLEHELWDAHRIRVMRRTLAEVAASAHVRGSERRMVLDGVEISVAYFRAGYTPNDYMSSSADHPNSSTNTTADTASDARSETSSVASGSAPASPNNGAAGHPTSELTPKKLSLNSEEPAEDVGELEWSARLLIERSRAVKCPSVAYHLAGTKKVQQVLAEPGVLERFVGAEDAAAMRQCFAGLYTLDDRDEKYDSRHQDGKTNACASQRESQEGDSDCSDDDGTGGVARTIRRALAHPERFVLKPQREGGGNNLYGAELVHALQTMSPDERAGYILMDRIMPPQRPAALVRNGAIRYGACVSELGVYGVFLGDGTPEGEILNRPAGHLLRTKIEGTDEGGVAAGFAVLSSPILDTAAAPPRSGENATIVFTRGAEYRAESLVAAARLPCVAPSSKEAGKHSALSKNVAATDGRDSKGGTKLTGSSTLASAVAFGLVLAASTAISKALAR